MIGKIIRMHRPRTRASAAGRHPHLAHLRDAVFALTRYIVDANPHALVERDGNILALTDYALAMRDAGVEPGEKVEACGARNLVGEDLRAWQAQMLAVAARAPRVKAPLTGTPSHPLCPPAHGNPDSPIPPPFYENLANALH